MEKASTTKEVLSIETCKFRRPKCGSYVVYDNKIWYATSTSGAGKNYRISLERDGENITLRGFTEELKSAKLLIQPTGYISNVLTR